MSYELTAIVRDSGRGLACYLADLLLRIKLQKITLHCVLTSIPYTKGHSRSFTHEILAFNENTDESLASQSEAFQVQMLRCVLIVLEIVIFFYLTNHFDIFQFRILEIRLEV